MGHNIWSVLETYSGRWVAVDGQGRVVCDAGTLDEALRAAAGRAATFLYAA